MAISGAEATFLEPSANLLGMSVQVRNNVHVAGSGHSTIFFAHGFGCDQNMWRLLAPVYAQRYRTVLFDLVGSGGSDLSAWVPAKYQSLQGYADDVVEIVREFAQGPAIFVGHSVSAMIGLSGGLWPARNTSRPKSDRAITLLHQRRRLRRRLHPQ
jgi:sigma-B regulation protein RsbQ